MTINGPKIVIENIFPNCYETKEEEDAEYEAYIWYRFQTNKFNCSQPETRKSDVSFAIDGIDVVTYCTPKDNLPLE